MTTLKDPLRFASFVEGASHVDDSEILLYQNSKSSETDDSNSAEDEDLNENEDERGLNENFVTSNRNSNTKLIGQNNISSRINSTEMNSTRNSGRKTPTESRNINTNLQNCRSSGLLVQNLSVEISDDES